MNNFKKTVALACSAFLVLSIFISCKQKKESDSPDVETVKEEKVIVYNTEDPKTIINAIAEATGGIDNLKALKDVSFNYSYVQPDGKKDLSEERYIFDNEISWAKYTDHDINVAPDLEGEVIQFYDGEKAFVYNNGTAVEDPALVGVGQFLRQANYMWFTMMFKLGDPGTIHEYQGQETIDGKTFDKLHVTYDPEVTGKAENDIYILYVNPETHIVEQFKFSLPAFKVLEPVLLAKLTYQDIDGIKVISRREMFAPAPDGSGYGLLVDQNTTNVKFNNGFTAEGLSKIIK